MSLGKNFIEGRTWTYQTYEEISAHFPYFKIGAVKRLVESLVQKGLLIKGNYNKTPWDKTVWYAFKNEEMFTIVRNRIIDNSESADQESEIGLPIPDTKTYTKPSKREDKDNRTSGDEGEKASSPFPIPSKEESGSASTSSPLSTGKPAVSKFGQPKKASEKRKIAFDRDKRKFDGITQEDKDFWAKVSPSVDLEKEILKAEQWALDNRRENYRKSLNCFVENAGNNQFNREQTFNKSYKSKENPQKPYNLPETREDDRLKEKSTPEKIKEFLKEAGIYDYSREDN